MRQARVDYWQIIRDIAPENLVFMDEAGGNLAMIRLYTRSLKGQRAVWDRLANRGKNVSLDNALRLLGAPLTIFGAMDGLTSETYIIRRVASNLWSSEVLAVDSSPTHKVTDDVKAALGRVGAQLVFLPPYSPDFSPIELFWSKVNNNLKSVCGRTYQALKEMIEFAYTQVSSEDIRNLFTNYCYCTSPE